MAWPGEDPDAVVDLMGQITRKPERQDLPDADLGHRPECGHDLPGRRTGISRSPVLRNERCRTAIAYRDIGSRPRQQRVDVAESAAEQGRQADTSRLGRLKRGAAECHGEPMIRDQLRDRFREWLPHCGRTA